MKIIIYILILFICFSCEVNTSITEGFSYTISGIVKDHDGVELSLIPQGGNIEDRITTVVENGTFEFKGKSSSVMPAQIRIESDVKNSIEFSSSSTVLLEPGEVLLTFDLSKEENNYRFSKPVIIEGRLNSELYKFIADYKLAVKGGSWVFNDSIRIDSMKRLVYPITRNNVFSLLHNQFEKGHPRINAYIFKETIIGSLNGKGFLSKDNLSLNDIKEISILHAKLDTTNISNEDSDLFDNVLLQLNGNSDAVVFKDFTLPDQKGHNYNASELVGRNNYVIMYFWFSACKPCRTFNIQMKEHYSELRAKDIEIVGVNVDTYKSQWIQSSEKDGIEWINLFAGDTSGLEEKYGIRGFPFKMVFDKNKDSQDIHLTTTENILLWSQSIK